MLPGLADPESSEIRASRANLRHLRNNLDADETILVVASASHGRIGVGLLAASEQRLLFVRHPIIGRKPTVISIPFAEVRSVHWKHQPHTGALQVKLADRTVQFGNVQPKARTWALWWTVKRHIQSSET